MATEKKGQKRKLQSGGNAAAVDVEDLSTADPLKLAYLLIQALSATLRFKDRARSERDVDASRLSYDWSCVRVE